MLSEWGGISFAVALMLPAYRMNLLKTAKSS
jgi:hypothetical protein